MGIQLISLRNGSPQPQLPLPACRKYTPEMSQPGFITVRYFRYLARYKLTPYGRILVLLTFFAAVGSITVEIPIYQIFCALFFLPAVSEFIGTLLRPKLDATCQLSGRATVGVPLQGVVHVRNRGDWTAFDVMVGFFEIDQSIKHTDPDRVIASLSSGGEADITFELRPIQRGVFPLGTVNVHSTFPFNLMRFDGGSCPLSSLIVIPAYESLDHFEVPMGICSRPLHPAPLLGAKGESPEYIGNREYVYGEAAVRLDFRAWARLGRPVVREYQDEYSFRSALILDTCQPTPSRLLKFPGQEANHSVQLESAVSLCAAIAEALHSREIVIDLFVAGPEIYLFRTPHAGSRLDTVLQILASVETTGDDAFRVLPDSLMESLESISSIVFVVLDWDERRRDLVDRIRQSGRGVRVLLIRNTPPQVEPPDESLEFLAIEPEQIIKGEVRSL